MNVLVFRIGRMGDFLVSVPAISAIRAAYPAARIVLLTGTSTKRAFAATSRAYTYPQAPLPWLDLVRPELLDEVIMLRPFDDLTAFIQLRRRLHRYRFTRSFILPFSGTRRSRLILKMLFLRGMGVFGPIHGWRRSIPDNIPQVEAAFTSVREAIGDTAAPSRDSHSLQVPESTRSWCEAFLRDRGWEKHRLIAMYVGGTYAHKRWSSDRFIEVAHALQQERLTAILLIGSQAERELCETVRARLQCGNAWNAAGETNILQLAGLLERCDVFIGNDGGSAHLAAAVGTPTVSIMSGVHPPGVWDPWGRCVGVIRHRVPCEACRSELHCPVGTSVCVQGITVADVLNCLNSLLKSPLRP